jgi:hypothetical protein
MILNVSFQFNEFDMGGGSTCSQGHIVIFDGASSRNFSKRYPSQKGSGFCSDTQPPRSDDKYENIVISTGNYLTVFMDTKKKGDDVKYVGFDAEFSTVPPGEYRGIVMWEFYGGPCFPWTIIVCRADTLYRGHHWGQLAKKFHKNKFKKRRF